MEYIEIPVICENLQCPNFGNVVNMISGIPLSNMDLVYESFDGSEEEDFCPVCKELGVAEDPIMSNKAGRKAT
ncbi:hypothetical protein FBQ99_00155 [Chloroflexi bacterium CFX2]|nr:MAG: hypothetical protein EDM79_14885 [Chloroflexota bacterium]MDL1940737.1 hypothetical protein [Chloroflexi bacterium CFX2]